ncbi:hypothetical protein IGB42_02551 [Andreprevotia sp. IGB-42]|uniref:hypothetical protein n=1 Tax=Andreprevotia sp. IGB-42 TaxID=2497473 RepID=UPI00135B82AE|nr:hypothetical protein [Andreprevotia sp. IGB-42]KAF0813150.1 hypothetical protein IGB42_02551 [Andreprevotia sp. IGB-42]
MSSVFTQPAHLDVERGDVKSILLVYFLSENVSRDDLDSSLASVLETAGDFFAIYFVECFSRESRVESYLEEGSVIKSRLEKAMHELNEKLWLVEFDHDSKEHRCRNLLCPDNSSSIPLDVVVQASLRELFVQQNGLVHAPQGFHYEKPSELHAQSFMRVTNVLEHYAGPLVLGYWSLSQLCKKDIVKIIVDTSGISVVAYAMVFMAHAWGLIKNPPVIVSCESYGGLGKISISQPEKTLILISATTSGGLRGRLIERRANEENILTLYFLGSQKRDAGSILCDLTRKFADSVNGYEPIMSFPKSSCALCMKHSYAVTLSGDQFAFEPPKIKEIVLVKTDLNDRFALLIDALAGTDFFKVVKMLGGKNSEFFLDFDSLWKADGDSFAPTQSAVEKIKSSFERAVVRYSPISLSKIVYSSYPYSKELAEYALSVLRKTNPIVSPELQGAKEMAASSAKFGAAALVISSVLDDSVELASINRDLRKVQPQGDAAYITTAFMAHSEERVKAIKMNLTYGENGPNTFSFVSLLDLPLPKSYEKHSWIAELDMLHELVQWADESDKKITDQIMQRIKFLSAVPSKGMAEGLFWPSNENMQLKIRSDFVFLTTDGGERDLSQADVFYVISALLHQLRRGVAGRRLIYKPYERSVLSPENFNRFSDGVIQASILRAARDYELSFSNCEGGDLSESMTEIVVSQIDGSKEALMEFLVAISCRRLVVSNENILKIVNKIADKEGLSDSVKLIGGYMYSQFLG